MIQEDGVMTKKSFLKKEKPMLTVMFECEIPETVIRRVRNVLCHGAEAFDPQAESLI